MQLSSGLHYRSFRTCKIIRFVKALGYRGKSRRFGSYTLQAAIAAVHAEAESVAATDWRQIVALYDRLVRIQPSPLPREPSGW